MCKQNPMFCKWGPNSGVSFKRNSFRVYSYTSCTFLEIIWCGDNLFDAQNTKNENHLMLWFLGCFLLHKEPNLHCANHYITQLMSRVHLPTFRCRIKHRDSVNRRVLFSSSCSRSILLNNVWNQMTYLWELLKRTQIFLAWSNFKHGKPTNWTNSVIAIECIYSVIQ